jgi:NADPH:quinone reductase
MKSVVYSQPGPDAVLDLVERPLPEVGVGQVRVRIVVSGVNPTDLSYRRRDTDVVSGQHVPGQDGAGVIDAVGAGVADLQVGDRVWVWDAAWQRAEGTAQEYVVLPARQAVPLPDAVSFDIGASLGIPALTAHRALTAFTDGPAALAPGALAGRTVLVAGGAGAVGNAAIQLATWSGAEVIATISDAEKARLATAAGAHHVINYRNQDLRDEIRRISPYGVDLVVEVDAHHNMATDVDVIAPHGGISIYTPGPGTTEIPAVTAMVKNISVTFILTYTTTTAQKDRAVAAVRAAVDAGAYGVGELRGLPLTRFTLPDTAKAYAAVEGHVVGKALIDVSPL